MDLLGRKARRLLQVKQAQLEITLQTANSQRSAIAELLSRVHSRESLVRDLILENQQLTDTVKILVKERMKPAPQPQTYRVSEEEQEAEWQLKQGIIDAQEYEHLLSELDFQNANIELDPDYSPREVTY